MEAYLSEVEGVIIKDEFFKLFLTVKNFSETVDVTFYGTTEAGDYENIFTDVLLSLAARQADVQNEDAGRITTTQGQLAKEAPFTPKAGERFKIKGIGGRVITVYPEMNRIIRADIQFDNPYG